MVSSTSGPLANASSSSFTLPTVSSANSINSFAQELAGELETLLQKSGGGSQVNITINPVQGQNSASSQFLVTVNTSPTATSSSTTPTTTTSTTGSSTSNTSTSSSTSNLLIGTSKVTVSPIPSPVLPIGGVTGGPISEVDAYWNAQPPEVQALRNMPDGADKDVYAEQLSQKGFAIDQQIMLWHWDPEMTMTVRANEGYTWIPSYGTANIPVGPGINFPGLPSYDPNNAPVGSVKVSTDFAKGTVHNWLIDKDPVTT